MYLLYYGKQQPETAIKESSISSRITGKGFQRLRGVMLKWFLTVIQLYPKVLKFMFLYKAY